MFAFKFELKIYKDKKIAELIVIFFEVNYKYYLFRRKKI